MHKCENPHTCLRCIAEEISTLQDTAIVYRDPRTGEVHLFREPQDAVNYAEDGLLGRSPTKNGGDDGG